MGKINPHLSVILMFGVLVICTTLIFLQEKWEPLFSPSASQGADAEAHLIHDQADALTGANPETAAREESRELLTAQSMPVVLPESEQRESLKGRVIDESGAPAVGAKVQAVRMRSFSRPIHPRNFKVIETSTTEEGWFTFNQIPAGTYSVVAVQGEKAGSMSAFAASAKSHPDGYAKAHEIVLQASAPIAGHVKAPDGKPLSHTLVVPVRAEALFVKTDGKGAFTTPGLPVDQYTLRVFAPGHPFKSESNVLAGKQDLEIVLCEGARVSGKVTREGTPMTGVNLMAKMRWGSVDVPLLTTSRKEGAYLLSPIEEGRHEISVMTSKYAAATKWLELAPGETREEINFELLETGALSGTVTAADTGEPLEGVWVSAIPKGTKTYSQDFDKTNTRTDGAGRFLFPALAPVDYFIGVKRAGDYVPMVWGEGKKIEVVSGEKKEDITIQLERGALVEIRVAGPNDEPILGATVNLDHADYKESHTSWYRGGSFLPQVEEVENGGYRIRGLKAGVYNLYTSRVGWNWKEETLALGPEDETASLTITLKPSLSTRGKVKDEQGRAVAGAVVGFRRGYKTLTDEAGAFSAHGVPEGYTYVEVMHEGYMNLSERVEIEEDQKEDLELTLKAMGKHFIAGKAKNDKNEPVAGMKVTVSQRDGRSRFQTVVYTGVDGAFRYDGLCEGKVSINAGMALGHPKKGYVTTEVDRRDVEFIIERYARVKGKVVDAAGDPVKAFTAYAYARNTRRNRENQEFTDGQFDLERVPPGNITIYAKTEDGWAGQSEPLYMEPGKTLDKVKIILSDESERGALIGVVKDMATGKPVAGAAVYAKSYIRNADDYYYWREPDETTGEDGSFHVEKVSPGKVNILVTHADYANGFIKDVSILKGETTKDIQVLLTKGSSIKGQVLEGFEGKAGAEVYAHGPKGNYKETVSGKNGFYEIKNIQPGRFTVTASLRDDEESSSKSVENKVEVTGFGTFLCDLVFKGRGTIEGVVYHFGEPKSGVTVQASPQKNKSDMPLPGSKTRYAHGETDKNGHYRIEGLSPGTYRVSAYNYGKEGSFRPSQVVEVNSGITSLDFYVGDQGHGQISGYVFKDGMPLPNTDVRLSGKSFSKNARTDKNGYYLMDRVPPGNLNLRTQIYMGKSRNSYSLSKSSTLAAGGALHVDFNFILGSSVLTGKVACNDRPLSRFYLYITGRADGSDQEISIRIRGNSGEYRIDQFPPGRYRVKLTQPWTMSQTVRTLNAQETRADFRYYSGSSSLAGKVALPEDRSLYDRAKVCLFTPGACTWEENQAFQLPTIAEGRISDHDLAGGNGAFKINSLPSYTVEVVAVCIKSDKIIRLDRKSITLFEKEKHTIDLALTKDE